MSTGDIGSAVGVSLKHHPALRTLSFTPNHKHWGFYSSVRDCLYPLSTLTTLRNIHVDCLDLREPEALIAFFSALVGVTHLETLGLDVSSWLTQPYPDCRPGEHCMTPEIAYISSQVCTCLY